MITANQMADLFVPKMEKFIDTNVSKRLAAGDWKLFFTEGKTSALYEDTKIEEASGTMREKVDGSDSAAFKLNDGYTKRRHVRLYGCAAEYTKLAWKTANNRLMMKISRACADSPNQMISDLIAAIIELGDSSLASVPVVGGKPMIDTLAADGLPIFSTAHTFKSTALETYANKTNSYQALTSDSLWDAVNTVRGWKNNLGDLLNLECKKLVVGFSNHKKAVELIRSKDDSETTNRSTNSLNELGLTFQVYNRMTNDTEWFLETNAENDYQVNFIWKPETERDKAVRSGTFLINVDTAFSHGVGDPRRWFANKAA